MTFEELKAEAERQGYNLIKKKPPVVRLKPCVCGRKHLSIWGTSVWYGRGKRGYLVACPICGKGENNEWTATEKEARELWNEYIAKEVM